MSTLRRQPPEVLSQLRVLYETERVPPHPLMVHNAVPESVAMAVQRAFIDMGSTEEGLALLKGVPMGGVRIATVEDFEVLTGMGLEAFYHQ